VTETNSGLRRRRTAAARTRNRRRLRVARTIGGTEANALNGAKEVSDVRDPRISNSVVARNVVPWIVEVASPWFGCGSSVLPLLAVPGAVTITVPPAVGSVTVTGLARVESSPFPSKVIAIGNPFISAVKNPSAEVRTVIVWKGLPGDPLAPVVSPGAERRRAERRRCADLPDRRCRCTRRSS
jgi:hypothetical protein